MSYVDVVFPLNLGRLTYQCPEELSDRIRPGMVVSAPLRKGADKGIVFGLHRDRPLGNLRELSGIHGEQPVIGEDMLGLIRWMSDYYIAAEGIILKQTLPREIFHSTRQRKTKEGPPGTAAMPLPEVTEDVVAPLVKAAGVRRYQAFLYHTPSAGYEYALARRLISSGLKRMIFILPETAAADRLFSAIGPLAAERACLLHSGIARGRRSAAMEKIIGGVCDIVIGTRAALFSPLRNISLIMVLHEHSGSYKLQDGVRYQMRDVAVMRGFLAKTPVVLSSVSPSADSWSNALSGKYRLVTPEPLPRPRARIVDMRYGKKASPHISQAVFETVRRKLREGERTIFVINRRGYATLLCKECGQTESCAACAMPMVLHKEEKVIKCHTCGIARPVPSRCSRCGGSGMELIGAGTQRIQEEIGALFGADTLRFDSDRTRGRSGTDQLLQDITGGTQQLVIGTKKLTRRLGGGQFAAAALLNMDASVSQPDFRAFEKAYMELSSIAGAVRPDGVVLIQTRFPGMHLYRHFRDGDYASFMTEELSQRRAMGYPPYVRLLGLTVSGDTAVPGRIMTQLASGHGDIEVLGPTVVRGARGAEEFRILLKSPNRRALNAAAAAVMERFGKLKGVTITADVDPA